MPALLAGAAYPERQAQVSTQYLGGRTTQNIFNSVNFLKAQGLVRKVSPNYQHFINTRFIQTSK
ncbi:hypothetical protein ACG9ZE_22550 [Acinetobacter sp. ULE_I053]|uniref:hypothetical protein n=1 Tax=Acinetobacter sp. ULE_I053 TaxID=3373069 RepID=UPI003AF63A14